MEKIEIKENRKFSIQVISDTHIEMQRLDWMDLVEPCAPYLALLGDIGIVNMDNKYENYKNFLLKQANQFEKIFVLAGNHEYYYGNIKGTQKKSKKLVINIQI